jgi:tyrosyl-tRNA synthetase
MMPPRDDTFRPRSDFLCTLAERGFIHQCTDLAALDMRLCAGTVVAYNGFDLTANSLHVGTSHPDHDAALVSKDRP